MLYVNPLPPLRFLLRSLIKGHHLVCATFLMASLLGRGLTLPLFIFLFILKLYSKLHFPVYGGFLPPALIDSNLSPTSFQFLCRPADLRSPRPSRLTSFGDSSQSLLLSGFPPLCEVLLHLLTLVLTGRPFGIFAADPILPK